ncbi:hypothetical protein P7C73_g248, partial [Tremellales sp. Uapishka_1]
MPSTTAVVQALQGPDKGKSRAGAGPLEKRVLPARIRRAAGGGAEGIRELEEMVLDWLDRWGAVTTTPPDSLRIHFTTLSMDLVRPPTFQAKSQPLPPPTATPLTPVRKSLPTPSPMKQRIETPSWIMVASGADDAEEAREELGDGRVISPNKRRRRSDQMHEDTSDSYYHALHKKYEVFERRQRIREKEKLQFERYKMRARIDLLKNMSSASWTPIVSNIVSRTDGPDEWKRGREKLREEGVDWLKVKLVKEGEELIKRYDQLLPSESRKNKPDSRTSTPSNQPSPSLSPPPPAMPPRVAALRDRPRSETKAQPKVKAKQSLVGPEDDDDALERVLVRGPGGRFKYNGGRVREKKGGTSRPGAERSTRARRSDATVGYGEDEDGSGNDDDGVEENGDAEEEDGGIGGQDGDLSSPCEDIKPAMARTPSPQPPPFYPPLTQSGLPCLIEAASRRQSAIEEADAARQKIELAKKSGTPTSKFIPREKTRESTRLSKILPFGMGLPPIVEWKSEFSISDEEDFWGIIAEREELKGRLRRQSLLRNPSPRSAIEDVDEALEMEGVEEQVVL